MNSKELAGYLIKKETGIMSGVNTFGLFVAEAYNAGKTIPEITKEYQKKGYSEELSEPLKQAISEFIKKMRDKGFKRGKINIISLKGQPYPPLLTVQLDLSWNCNLKCRHCYLVDTELIDEPLTKREQQGVINQMCEMRVPKIAFLGGEPLLAPNFFELAGYAFHRGLKLYTTTNCVLVTPKIARRLVQVGFNEIDVSLDGATVDSHEFIRGKGTFDATLRGIKNLVNVGLRVKSATVISKKNLNELWDLIKLGKELGLCQMYFNALIPIGSSRSILQEYELKESDWFVAKEIIKEWNSNHRKPRVFAENWFAYEGFSIDRPKTLESFEYAGCKAGKRELIITPDGFVTPCPLLSTKRQFQTMNIRKYSLEEIWLKDEWIVKLRQVNENTIKGKCRNCVYRIICKGGCHVLALFKYNDINQPDPRCPLTN